jgi:hypothetical protein
VGVGLGHRSDDGGDVDQDTLALVAQVGKGGPRPVYVAHDVHVEDPAEILQGDLLERREGGEGGIIDPHVDPAELSDRTPGQLLHGCEIADVGRHGQCPGPHGLALRGDLLQGLGTARGQDDRCPLLPERERRGTADATGRSRHNNH